MIAIYCRIHHLAYFVPDKIRNNFPTSSAAINSTFEQLIKHKDIPKMRRPKFNNTQTRELFELTLVKLAGIQFTKWAMMYLCFFFFFFFFSMNHPSLVMSLVFEMSFVNLQFSEVINIEKSTDYN